MVINCLTDRALEIPGDSFEGMNVDGQELHRALLEDVKAPSSSFRKTNLRGAFLTNSSFDGSDFTQANLVCTFLDKASLVKCKLLDCFAISCIFKQANLQHAVLDGANAAHADFTEALLQGASMLCLDLEQATFSGAVYDQYTRWPSGFKPEKYGAYQTPVI
jgi:uncharacterized protein YjbI with pentapeptide repeats